MEIKVRRVSCWFIAQDPQHVILYSPSGGDGDISQQTVQFLIVLDGQGDVTGDDTRLLVVAGSISSELKNLCTEVLKDGGQVDGSSGTHASGVLLQEWKGKS